MEQVVAGRSEQGRNIICLLGDGEFFPSLVQEYLGASCWKFSGALVRPSFHLLE